MTGMELWAIVPELFLGTGVLILLPLGSFLSPQWRSLASWIALTFLTAAFVASARMLAWPVQAVFEGTYAVDPFAVYFKLLAIAATALVLFATESLFRGWAREAQVPPLLLLACLGMVGLAASQDLALVALFLQLIAVSSYVLVACRKADAARTEAALKLFLFSAAAGGAMLYGIALVYGLTGTLRLPEIAPVLSPVPGAVVFFATALLLMGFGFKVTLVPFHGWAPDTYQGAPTPLAGLLAVGPKAAALAVLARTLFVSLPNRAFEPWIAGAAAATMTLGNVMALPQPSVKRLLAYSSIAQAGYLLVGIAAPTRELGMPGFLLYLAVYLLMNLAAFLAVDALERSVGSDQLDRLAGTGRTQPVAALCLSIAVLSLAGIPPLGGFVGKTLLLGAALSSPQRWLSVVLAINFALSLAYYARVLEALYLRPAPAGADAQRLPRGLGVALLLLAAGTLASGIVVEPVLRLAERGATLLAAGTGR